MILKVHILVLNLVLTKKFNSMKRIAMILLVTFTMGMAASSVSASTVNDDAKKAKKECCNKDKKDCSADKKAEKK